VRSAPCTSRRGAWVCWLSIKTKSTVSQFEPQNRQLRFGYLGLKITATVSWFGPQNQVGFGLSVVPQIRWREVSTGHTSRCSGLLRMEASRGRVSQPGLKTGGGATVAGVCGIITELTWS
jgi:hypothetical protein